jgi:hypothetical protein
MNVWVNDAIISAALADCAGSDIVPSESNLSSNSSLDGFSSSRRSAWTWVESTVISGSAQELFGVVRRNGRIAASSAAASSRADDGGVAALLTICVIDPDSEHHGKIVDIARRHLGAVDVGMGDGGEMSSDGGGMMMRGILPSNSRGGNNENYDVGGGDSSSNDDDHLLPSDLTQLTHLHEPAVVNCLHRRYKLSGWKMYTSSGPILIAINPCRNVPGLYDDAAMRMYWRWGERLANGASSSHSTPPPLQIRTWFVRASLGGRDRVGATPARLRGRGLRLPGHDARSGLCEERRRRHSP